MTLHVFGYGSLVWRPDLPAIRQRPAWLHGWARRFWQGSPDHRGTPDAPGRVVTLVAEADGCTLGVVYEVDPAQAAAVLARLDVREVAGFERFTAPVHTDDGVCIEALVYRAAPDNPHFLGPAPLPEMAAHVVRSRGHSGPNTEYVLRLDDALHRYGHPDPHVATLARAVRALL